MVSERAESEPEPAVVESKSDNFGIKDGSEPVTVPALTTLRDCCTFLLNWAAREGLTEQQANAFLLIGLTALQKHYSPSELQAALEVKGQQDERAPPQSEHCALRLLIQGKAGTGKTKLIQTVQALYVALGKARALRTAAFTHVAASAIGGTTLHFLFKLPLGASTGGKLSKHSKRWLQNVVPNIELLIADEYSMLGRGNTANLAQRIAVGRGLADATVPMGGLAAVFTGDIFQLPPVGDGALYEDPSANCKSLDHQRAGRLQFKQFDSVLFFDVAKRQEADQDLLRVCDHFRFGTVDEKDCKLLQTRVLSVCKPSPAFLEQMVIITPRNALRTLLNFHFCKQLATARSRPLLIAAAVDRPTDGEPIDENIQRSLRRLPDESTCGLMGTLTLALGMPCIIKSNLWNEMGIHNGTLGTLVGLVLEAADERAAIAAAPGEQCTLRSLPVAVLVQLQRMPTDPPIPRLPGCPPNVIAIQPIEERFSAFVVPPRQQQAACMYLER
jgi:hypothetical protein